MQRYQLAGDPFAWLGNGKHELVLNFIRNTAIDSYRQWVRDEKKVPTQEAAKLLSELTCNGINCIVR